MGTGRIATGLLLYSAAAGAQTLISATGPGGRVGRSPIDEPVLESREPLQDLPCTVTSVKPVLGFDLRFHTAYTVGVPLRGLSSHANTLTLVLRVAPESAPGEPVFLRQRMEVPAFAEALGGEASIQGWFDLGEGDYHVGWLLRDRSEKICSGSWELAASLPAKDRGLRLDIPAGRVKPSPEDVFHAELAPDRARHDAPLRVGAIVNFAPQDSQSAALGPTDIEGLIGVLRAILRDTSIGELSTVAVNIQSEQTLFHQGDWRASDLPALGVALKSLRLATVDLSVLAKKNGGAEFLVKTIREEIQEDRPDALIVVSPRVLVDERTPRELTKQMREAGCPVFYLSYHPGSFDLDPSDNPWRDVVGGVVKQLRGVKYTIRRPRDAIGAWSGPRARCGQSARSEPPGCGIGTAECSQRLAPSSRPPRRR